jgi:hypothetical protein
VAEVVASGRRPQLQPLGARRHEAGFDHSHPHEKGFGKRSRIKMKITIMKRIMSMIKTKIRSKKEM